MNLYYFQAKGGENVKALKYWLPRDIKKAATTLDLVPGTLSIKEMSLWLLYHLLVFLHCFWIPAYTKTKPKRPSSQVYPT